MSNFNKLKYDSILLATLCSAVLGVSISYWDIYLFHVLLGLLSIFHLLWFKEKIISGNDLKIKINKIYFPFILTFFWYSASILWSPNFIYSLKYLFYIFCGFSISALIMSYSKSLFNFNKIFKFLKFFFIIELLIAVLESFTLFKMPISRYSSLSAYFGKRTSAAYKR